MSELNFFPYSEAKVTIEGRTYHTFLLPINKSDRPCDGDCGYKEYGPRYRWRIDRPGVPKNILKTLYICELCAAAISETTKEICEYLNDIENGIVSNTNGVDG